ncbi:MAG TPA: PH domain-containing protein [Marmoricola sp.]|nr:PH domain-containing protein [Marmoricola sp.]
MSEPPSEQSSEPHGELRRDTDWRRLDARMLLVHPVNEVVRFLPVIVGIFVLGSSGEDNGPWHYIGVAVPVAIGLLRFASTKFRITPGQIELHRGILGRNVLTAPLDRVRTVELTATPIHRILGLERVEVGTGSANKGGDARLILDSLGREEAQRLRIELLHRTPEVEGTDVDADEHPPRPDVILRLDPAWVRYAPLTSSGVLIALGALGAVSGPLSSSNVVSDLVDSHALDSLAEVAIPALVLGALLGFAVVSAVLASAGYLLGNWGFTLTRDDRSRTYHVRRGALTTRETTIDMDRLRGLEIHEPLGLRLAGGGRLTAIVTGLDRRSRGSSPIVPPAPRSVVVGVGEQLLDGPVRDEGGPFHVGLVQHGPQAFRRRLVRAVVPLALVPAVLGILAGLADVPVWLVLVTLPLPVVGLALGLDRYSRLGHALTASYVVVRWGSLRGRRDALQRTGIIGWNVRQSFFQRRAGLVSLTATTAAGQQSYEILDVPESTAIEFADAAVPGLLTDFVELAVRAR